MLVVIDMDLQLLRKTQRLPDSWRNSNAELKSGIVEGEILNKGKVNCQVQDLNLSWDFWRMTEFELNSVSKLRSGIAWQNQLKVLEGIPVITGHAVRERRTEKKWTKSWSLPFVQLEKVSQRVEEQGSKVSASVELNCEYVQC